MARDLKTLRFQGKPKDDFCEKENLKERREDPRIAACLLVRRAGFPVEIYAVRGTRPETETIIPAARTLQERDQVTRLVAAPFAGLPSAWNLDALNDPDLHSIAGS